MGRVGRAHGLGGDVVVSLITTETQRLAVGSVLVADGQRLVVRSSRPHNDRWVVGFEGVGDREGADALRGLVLRAEAVEGIDPDALWVHEIIGAAVVDTDGVERGVVEAVQANPASDLLVLDSGALVPLRFVVGWRERARLLEVDVPAGLFEL